MLTIDSLSYNSRLRYENAGEKFAFAMMTLCICVMSRSIAVSCIVLATNGILNLWKGGIPLSDYVKLLTAPLIFLLLCTLTIALNISHTPLDLFAIPIGSRYLTSGRESLFYAVQLILTALSAVSCLYFLALNTPMTDILTVLRKLHCPKLLIELMLLIYRFIFILLASASAISDAQRCRLGNITFRTSMKSFGMLGSALMIRAVARSDKLYNAMEARCYDGTIRVLSEEHPPKKKVIVWIILFDGALLLFALWRKFFA